jgi:hypothetical protein
MQKRAFHVQPRQEPLSKQRRRKKKAAARVRREIPQLPVPPPRRVPKYKRAQERYSWDAAASGEKWAAIEARWARDGIPATTVHDILRRAATARMDYEDQLMNDVELAKDEIDYRTFIRGLNRRLRAVFKWLARYRWLPEAQVTEEHLARAVSEVAEDLVTLAPRAHRALRFEGRPGEPWLRPLVVQLSEHFRGRGMRANAANRTIVEALALAGHGDVANLDLIKRLTRKH